MDDRQTHASFLASIDDVHSYDQGGFLGLIGHRGDAPAPFDALDGPRLAAPGRSHPLPLVRPAELIRPSTAGLDGVIEVEIADTGRGGDPRADPGRGPGTCQRTTGWDPARGRSALRGGTEPRATGQQGAGRQP